MAASLPLSTSAAASPHRSPAAAPVQATADEAAASAGFDCSSCRAACCRLEVMLFGDDEVPAALTGRDRWGGWVMRRLADGWCAALDRQTRLCTIYDRRPAICRDYQLGDHDCREQRRQWPLPQEAKA